MRKHFWVVAGLFLMVLLFTPHGLKAQDNDMDGELQKDIQQLLANPIRNYRRFGSRNLRFNDSLPAIQAKLEEALGKTEDPEAVAALQWLLAKADEYRFADQKRDAFLNIRDRRIPFKRNGERPSREEIAKISKEAGESVDDSPRFARLPAMIAALNKLPEKELSFMLRRDMVNSINSILEKAKPGKLPEEMRKVIVDEYVNAAYDPLASFNNADKTVAVYRNLQLDAELKKLCETPPKDIEKPEVLLRRIQLSEAAGMEEQAIAFADELFARLGAMDTMQADRWIYELAEDYARLRPEVALEKFKEMAKVHSRVYISLYRASRRIDQFGDEMRRCREWLLPCLELQKPIIEKEKAYRAKNKDNNNPISPERYFYGLIFQEVDRENRLAFREPAHHNESDATLFVADYILSRPGMEKDPYYGYILYRKGICLKRIGRLDEARKAFQASLDCESTEPRLKDTVNNELKRLEQQ